MAFGVGNHFEDLHFLAGVAIHVHVVLICAIGALEFVGKVFPALDFDQALCNIGYAKGFVQLLLSIALSCCAEIHLAIFVIYEVTLCLEADNLAVGCVHRNLD